ncbi:MAG TPA: hypothetical protein VLD37_05585 [Candidatus Bilamarchaeum sp.]|nr:hypothetical protein [Candidatus Bilamarchaeum sp.]
MRKTILEGEGVNLKSGRHIRFRIPSGMSDSGQEAFLRNVGVSRLSHAGRESDETLVRKIVLGSKDSKVES